MPLKPFALKSSNYRIGHHLRYSTFFFCNSISMLIFLVHTGWGKNG
ncbi:hypothetical protein HMPREF0004_0798 [Achromobacter piechaudii ATCC 43553]|uniref:Uncharacterized protein n=1 Tax=Achromobacter piechaudii ATCC 43553 TaxID=742159 RepID=D4X5Q1_9BURK|nr:hypothetical protein HMPREF0004_0798 [Achromobacter piechaudii ATCC 43553]